MFRRMVTLLALASAFVFSDFDNLVADEDSAPNNSADAGAVVINEAAPTLELRDVQRIQIGSLRMDARRTLQLKEHFETRLGTDAADAILIFQMLAIMGDDISAFNAESPLNFRADGYVTRPQIEYYGDMIIPYSAEVRAELLEAEESIQREPGVYDSDGTLIVVSDRHIGMSGAEGIKMTDDDIARLRKLIHETEGVRFPRTVSVSTMPATIGRSVVKSELAAVRARLMTEAQRRDNEEDLDWLSRSVWQKLQVSLFDGFFNDTEQMEFSLEFDPPSRSVSVQLQATAAKGTGLDQYIARLGASRNRLMSFLHPDQQAFVAITVPLPEDLSLAIPKLAGLTFAKILGDASAAKAGDGVEQTLQQIAERRQIECLFQVFPKHDETHAQITIMPLLSANNLQNHLLQLAAAVSESGSETVGEVAGWPVQEFLNPSRDLGTNFSAESRSFFVMTDECIAWMIGTEDDLSILASVLQREFEPPPAAGRFGNTVFAAATTLKPLQAFDEVVLGGSISAVTASDEDQFECGPGQMEISLRTAPHQLILTARFAPEAAVAGVWLYDMSLQALSEILEDVYE